MNNLITNIFKHHLLFINMHIGIIKYPGSNCDEDTFRYFSTDENGEKNNVFFIWHKETIIPSIIDLLIIPGGFAFGDRYYTKGATGEYFMDPGKMAVKSPVSKIIMQSYKDKIPILGICNGFQILVHLGLLPGTLGQNNSKQFCSKMVDCIVYNGIKTNNFTFNIANEYGRYFVTDDLLNEIVDNEQIFLTYDNYINGSTKHLDRCIGGITNKEKTVFGMMPHPERSTCTTTDGFKTLFFKMIKIKQPLKSVKQQQDSMTHRKIIFKGKVMRLMNSEHISYRSTKPFLSTLHTREEWVVQGPGENAGIVDIGDGYCLAMRMESHNHPTYIDPYNGAATGVGGIIRDIIAMGAKPIALLDFLRFGNNEKATDLMRKAIRGIANYGNTIGVPNVGGDLYKNHCFNKNPIVNVACLGIVKRENIIYGNALNEKSILMYIGAKTGNDGIGGAAMASQAFGSSVDHLKNNIQIGDPFLERLLLEACCELAEEQLIEGMQDMGAGGVLCASLEVIKRGRVRMPHKNLGCDIYIDKIPTKTNMESCDILISESQERMLLVCLPANMERIKTILTKWDLEAAEIGYVTAHGRYDVYEHSGKNDCILSLNIDDMSDSKNSWIVENVNYKCKCKNVKVSTTTSGMWNIYDNSIGSRVVKGPLDKGHYSILDIYEVNKQLIITWGGDFMTCYNEMLRIRKHAKPLAIINCLNFGHPKNCMFDFKTTIDELNEYCKKYNVPVVGGNVSLYNTTNDNSINPTPVFVMVGLV
jgi:phosphoribosylformylglycinamidine synthase subunit PurL